MFNLDRCPQCGRLANDYLWKIPLMLFLTVVAFISAVLLCVILYFGIGELLG